MPTDARKEIVGTWRLVHTVEFMESGRKRYPFGQDAVGYIVYSESGVMAVQITRKAPIKRSLGGVSSARRTISPTSDAMRSTPIKNWCAASSKGSYFRDFTRTFANGSTVSSITSYRLNRAKAEIAKFCGNVLQTNERRADMKANSLQSNGVFI